MTKTQAESIFINFNVYIFSLLDILTAKRPILGHHTYTQFDGCIETTTKNHGFVKPGYITYWIEQHLKLC